MDSWKEWIKNNLGMLIGAAAGLLVAVLFLTIGFFQTMLILIFMGAGAVLAGIPSVRKAVTGWLRRVFGREGPKA